MSSTYKGTITLASVTDATQLYTWVRYSNGAATNPTVTPSPQSDTKQIGFAYNKTSATASNIYGDYTWSDYMGESGTDGIGVVSIVEQYYLSDSSSEPHGNTWKTTPDPWVSGKYYWTRSVVTWTADNPTNPTYTTPVLAQGLNDANSTASSANTTASQASSDLTAYITQTDATLGNLQNQIDGQIEVWYFEVNPGTSTDPSLDWTTTTEKDRHLGDLYYNVENGHSWRWLKDENNTYKWQQIPDGDAAAALAAANAAQATANNKRRVFTSTPTVPYDVGDLWVSGNTVKYCTTAKTSTQSYNEADWILTATDDTNAVTQVDVYYAINTVADTPPAGYDDPSASANWSTTPPAWEDGKYIWSVTVTYKGGQAQTPSDPVNVTGATGATGAPAPYIVLDGPTNVVTVDTNNNNSITPSGNITITATYDNIATGITWSYKVEGSTSSRPSYITQNTNNVVLNTSNFVAANKNTVTIIASGSGVSDSYTITCLKNGQNGTDGTDGTSVIWKGESSTAPANPQNLWAYYNTTDKKTYIYNGSEWEVMAVSGVDGQDATQYYYHVVYCNNPTTGAGYATSPSNQLYTGTYTDTNSADAATWAALPAGVKWNYTSTVNVILSNESHTLTANAEGIATIDANAYTDIQIFEGGIDKTGDYTVKVSNASSGSKLINNITINIDNTVNPRRVTITAIANNFTSNVVPIDIYKGTTKLLTKQFTISVSKDGPAGNGIYTTTIQYAVSSNGQTAPSSGWQSTVPSVANGQYLWTWTRFTYTDSTTKDAYTVSRFGEDGDLYRVESNYDFIYTVAHGPDVGDDHVNLIFSPYEVLFKVYKEDTLLTPNVDYWFRFYFLGPEEDSNGKKITVPFALENTSGYDNRNVYTIDSTYSIKFLMDGLAARGVKNDGDESEQLSPWTLIYNFCLDGNAFFALNIYADSNYNNLLTRYAFYNQNYLTNSLASFDQTATTIQYAVNNAQLEFSASGLKIFEGGLSIYSTSTAPTDDDRIFYFDSTTGNLHIDGNGTFSGKITATDGEFTGIIHAREGEFNGEITALSGHIGGFIINSDSLQSERTFFDPDVLYYEYDGSQYVATGDQYPIQGKVYYNYIDDNYEIAEIIPNITLNGSTGTIFAESITLGKDATIQNYIKLGSGENESWIYNPDYAAENESLPYFFKVNNNVYLTADGQLNLNNIVLDGITSTIKGKSPTDPQDPNFGFPAFEIDPLWAKFPNIEASGKIVTSVFEIDSVQTVGGMMLFKPSVKVERHVQFTSNDVLYTKLILDEPVSDLIKEYASPNYKYVAIVDQDGHLLSRTVTQNNETVEINAFTVVNVKDQDPNYDNKPTINVVTGIDDRTILSHIIILGGENDLIIGVNSTDGSNSFLRPRGLTISEFKPFNPVGNKTIPKVYLGDLSRSGFEITGISSDAKAYGLYSNNVILNGSLTTQITSNTATNYSYAGVNTLSQASAKASTFEPYFSDTSKIVFWAGSEGVEAPQIQNAPFFVTEQGSIFSKKGVFESVLISKSVIKGVDIYGARIHGIAKDASFMDQVSNEYGLAFFNATQGIVFKAGGDSDDSATTLFGIGQTGLYTPSGEANNYFISITTDTSDSPVVDFSGRNYTAERITASDRITGMQLVSDNLNNKIFIGGTSQAASSRIYYDGPDFNSYILFCNDNQKMSISHGASKRQIQIGSDDVEFNVTELSTPTNFQLGSTPGAGYMRYKKVSNGYDLYV